MEISAEQVLVYVLVAYLLIQSILIRKDAITSVNNLGKILHEAQTDAKDREEGIWKRANVELEVKNRQMQEAHKMVLRTKIPIVQAQPDLPFRQTNNRRTGPRPGVEDAATMG